MKSSRFSSTLKRIGGAYFSLIRKIFFLFLFIAVVAAAGFAISYPLWLFATRSRQGYTLTALLTLAGAAAATVIIRLRRIGKSPISGPAGSKRRIVKGFIYTGCVIGFIILLYFVVFLFSQSLLVIGIPLLLVFLLLFGLFLNDIRKAGT